MYVATALARFGARTFVEAYGDMNQDSVAAYVEANCSPAVQAAELDDPDVLTLLALAGADLAAFACLRRNPRANRFYAKCGFRDAGGSFFHVGSDRQNDRIMVARVQAL